MAEQQRIPYDVIVAAQRGDAEAMQRILRHYAGYIRHFSRRRFYNVDGSYMEMIDDDVRQQLEANLMMAIVFKFDCKSLPEDVVVED